MCRCAGVAPFPNKKKTQQKSRLLPPLIVLLVFEMSDPNSEFPKPLDDPKQDARLARLSVKKISEEKLRRELATIAHAKCSEYGKAFSDCSQREGFKVVFTCRDECAACKFEGFFSSLAS